MRDDAQVWIATAVIMLMQRVLTEDDALESGAAGTAPARPVDPSRITVGVATASAAAADRRRGGAAEDGGASCRAMRKGRLR